MNRQPTQKQKISHAINVFFAYLMSGAMIVYGGVNLSLNVLQAQRGMYEGMQWKAAIPLVLIFGLLPIIAGILVLIYHPATRKQAEDKAAAMRLPEKDSSKTS